MKQTTIFIFVFLLTLTSVSAIGMGIIVNQNYGEVEQGKVYEKELRFFPFDTSCSPYTEEPCVSTVDVQVTDDDPWYTHEEWFTVPWNVYSTPLMTMTIPIRAELGNYSYEVCAIAQGGINVGACTEITYEVIESEDVKKPKKPKKNVRPINNKSPRTHRRLQRA